MAEIIKDEKNQNIDAEAIDLEQLDGVSGGAVTFGGAYIFTDSDVKILKRYGITVNSDKWYLGSELLKQGMHLDSALDIKPFLKSIGINCEQAKLNI